MKALLLAAGYAMRLRPLTEQTAKPLLPVGGRPMADWILDSIEESGTVDGVHVVTNAVYAEAFERWGAERGVTVWNDGTATNDDRLGALGDIRFAVEQGGLGSDGLLVIAADNLFEFSLTDYVDFWFEKGGSALAVHRLADPSLASLYGVIELDRSDRVVGMQEKPEQPRSDLVSTATYLFPREHLALLDVYLDEGNAPDPPGAFLAWLCEREPVYGFRFSEAWLDIGDPEQLLEADNRYRVAAGLPVRDVYTL
ncbi:MAG TPA: nucleotidyltransferase family protein [Gaiellaceae bacterium]|jgi:glucose-1-phosphate thymidylyltransferase|nr:nucleotidyltransferase family protein [Gaiellaceae bacterium]